MVTRIVAFSQVRLASDREEVHAQLSEEDLSDEPPTAGHYSDKPQFDKLPRIISVRSELQVGPDCARYFTVD